MIIYWLLLEKAAVLENDQYHVITGDNSYLPKSIAVLWKQVQALILVFDYKNLM